MESLAWRPVVPVLVGSASHGHLPPRGPCPLEEGGGAEGARGFPRRRSAVPGSWGPRLLRHPKFHWMVVCMPTYPRTMPPPTATGALGFSAASENSSLTRKDGRRGFFLLGSPLVKLRFLRVA